MCGMAKTKGVSCQLSLYPLCREDCTGPIKEAVDLIESNTQVSSNVNEMSTIIQGERKEVLRLIESIQQRMEEKGVQYTMVLTLSNICGCD